MEILSNVLWPLWPKKQVLSKKFARHTAKIASFANMNKLVTYSLRKSGWNLLILDDFCYKILSFLLNISFHGKTGFYEVKTKPRNLLFSELCYAKLNEGPDISTKRSPKICKKCQNLKGRNFLKSENSVISILPSK